MRRKLLSRRPSPAMLVAVVALASSLTGGAVAATLIDGDDIARKAIAKKHIKKNAVNTKKVDNGTLLVKDFKAGELKDGVQGLQGLQGPKGDKGNPGDDGEDGADGTDGARGSAAAYAFVLPTGGLDESQSFGMTDANVVKSANTGVYCFPNMPFKVRSAVATGHGADRETVTVALPDINSSFGGCAAGVPTAFVYNLNDVADDDTFMIWFED